MLGSNRWGPGTMQEKVDKYLPKDSGPADPSTTEKKQEQQSEELPIHNRFVGKVLPNPLDFYDNPTYTLTLYMIPPLENSGTASQEDSDETESNGSDKRKDTPKGEAKKSGGGFLNGSLKAAPENTVILAKTGVTAGVTIDNLSITTATGPGGVQEKTVEFDIVQPGAASFPDMIVRAQQYLGIPTETKDFPLFLEINFLGRTESTENPKAQEGGIGDPDNGGVITTIRGPYIYPLELKNFSINIDETGSRYAFETAIRSELAYRPNNYKLPVLMTTVGKTITEHVEMLQSLLNDAFKSSQNPEATPDIIEFDLSGLIADQKKMKEEHDNEADRFAQGVNLNLFGGKTEDPLDIINNPNPADREKVNRDRIAKDIKDTKKTKADFKKANPMMIFDETLSTTETTTLQQIPGLEDLEKPEPTDIQKVIEENKSSGFVTKSESGKIEVTARRGLRLSEYFEMLLSMNDEFFQKISKVQNPGQPFIKEDQDKKATAKFKMNAEVVDLEYNAKRKKYVKKIIYKPTLYKTLQNTGVTDETFTVDTDGGKKRLQEMDVQKAYSYIFTGRNDQIVNLDISYDKGIEFLLPVNGGLVGDPSLNTRHSTAEPVPTSEDSNKIKDLFDKIDGVKSAKSIFGFFDDLKGKGDELLNDITGILGLGSTSAKQLLGDLNSSSARALADALTTKITRESISNLLLNKKGASNQEGSATSSDDERTTETGESYTPTPSGYTYGLDLLGGTKQAEDLVKKELQKRTEQNIKDQEEAKVNSGPTENTTADYINSDTMAVGQKNNRNSLMAYLFMQQNVGRFLVSLDMTVRGDPWYLGQPSDKKFQTQTTPQGSDTTESDATGISTDDADNFFLLEINSPRYFDLNVDDEDLNTGKWYKDGEESTAYFFSGIYRLIEATHRFNNGVYLIDLRAAKETAVDLSQIEPTVGYGFTAEETEFLKQRQADSNAKTESDGANRPFSPAYIRGYITGERALAGLDERSGPVNVNTLLAQGIITSEEAESYRKAYPEG